MSAYKTPVVETMSSPAAGISPAKNLNIGGSASKRHSLVTVGGAQDWTSHSFSEEEVKSVADHINVTLYGDDAIKSRMPVSTDAEEFFKAVHDGVLLWYVTVICMHSSFVCMYENK